jgi:hypothetical protein
MLSEIRMVRLRLQSRIALSPLFLSSADFALSGFLEEQLCISVDMQARLAGGLVPWENWKL